MAHHFPERFLLATLSILLCDCCGEPTDPVETVDWRQDGNGYVQFATNDPTVLGRGEYALFAPDQEPMTTVAALVEKLSGYPNAGFGIVFCAPDAQHFYRLLIDTAGHYSISKKVGLMYCLLQDWTESSYLKTGAGMKNLIEVRSDGSGDFTVYFNKNHASFFSDSAFTGGKSGFYVQIGKAAAEAFPAVPADVRLQMTENGAVMTVAGAAGSAGSDNGTGSAARFNYPQGITTDSANLYVADSYNSTIRRIVLATGEVTTLAGSAGVVGSADGTGASASFGDPRGIALVGGYLYVADYMQSTIRKIAISTSEVTTFAGVAGMTGDSDGLGSAARFHCPNGLATDGISLFVVDTFNSTIRKIVIATGAVTTLAGSPGFPGSSDGIGAAARFNFPAALAYLNGDLYVSDYDNCTIRKLRTATAEVSTIAGMTNNPGSDDGTGSEARFYHPGGIATDGSSLYLTDISNDTIRKVMIATAEVTTLAGSAGSVGSSDGTGPSARFQSPCAITVCGDQLYVADTYNFTIRRIKIPSASPAIAGSDGGQFGECN